MIVKIPSISTPASGTEAPLEILSACHGRVENQCATLKRHIQREEGELLPMAARLLSEDDLARVGRAMRERRGIGEM